MFDTQCQMMRLGELKQLPDELPLARTTTRKLVGPRLANDSRRLMTAGSDADKRGSVNGRMLIEDRLAANRVHWAPFCENALG